MMIHISESIAAVIMVLGGLPSLAVVYLLWSHTKKPAVIWLISASLGFFVWAISFTIASLAPNHYLRFIGVNIFIVMPFFTSVSWFLFSYEFTFKKQVPTWVYGFFGVVLAEFVLGIMNPGNIMYTVNPLSPEAFPAAPTTLRFFLNVVVSYPLVLFGTGMVIGEGFRSAVKTRKHQSVVVFVTTLIIVGMSLLKVANIVPSYFDPTPVAVSFGFLFLSYSITNHDLGRRVPIARQQTVELSNDIMIVTDENGEILDANEAATSLFGSEIFNQYIGGIINPDAEEFTIQEDASPTRYFNINKTHLNYGRGSKAYLYILSEVTRIRRREEELDTVQTVMQRVFRHNTRNKLMTVSGQAQLISEGGEADTQERAESIQETAEELQSTSEKAMELGNVVSEREVIEENIGTLVTSAVQKVKNKHPAVEVTHNIEEGVAQVHPKAEVAIEELIENSVKFNDSDTKYINISVTETSESFEVWIADNGNGIPKTEIDVLRTESETPKKHSNGAGLWLVKWIVQRSNGELQFYTHDQIDGTVVKISFQK